MQTLKKTFIIFLFTVIFNHKCYAGKVHTPPNITKPAENKDPKNLIGGSKKIENDNKQANKNSKETITLPIIKNEENDITSDTPTKIEVIPKSKEVSYEVKVTNVIEDKSNKNGCKPDTPTSPDAKNDNIINLSKPEQEKKNLKSNNTTFKDDPPFDVKPDTNLEFGLVNVFPLSKLYSLYLNHSGNFKDYYEISTDVLKDEVPDHPYNSRVLSIVRSVADQIKFNCEKINQMNNDLESTQLDSARTTRMLKLSEEHHRQIETESKQLELNFKNWTSSFNFTRDKLVLMSKNLENIENCILTTSMHQCQKHFEFFFDFLNFSNLFKEDTFCTYSSICEIVLKKKIYKDFKFDILTSDLKQARDSNFSISKLVEEIKKDERNTKAKENRESYKKKAKSMRSAEINAKNDVNSQQPVKKGNSTHLCFLSLIYFLLIELYIF